jgi:flagellar assembly factor FliW
MLIHTVSFGDLEIPEDKVINFKEGLPGFPQTHQFAVLELENLKPFQYLQALEGSPIALLIINPFLIDPDYRFQLSSVEMEELKGSPDQNLTVYSIAYFPENPKAATINLLAPIVINEKERCGKQIILHDTRYSIRHPLINLWRNSEAGSTGV